MRATFESLSDNSLRQVGKLARCKAGGCVAPISELHARKIRICASFLISYDKDIPRLFSRTLAFASPQKFMLALFKHLTPFPGTPVCGQIEVEGRLQFERRWLAPGFRWGDVVFDPTHFLAGALPAAYRDCGWAFHQPVIIFRRAVLLTNRKHLIRSVALNFLVRKDVLEKQGIPLGQDQS